MNIKIRRFAAAAFAVVMLLASVAPSAMAMDVEHEIAMTTHQNVPPFSVSYGDQVAFMVTAEFQYGEPKPDEVCIDLNDCLSFVGADLAVAYDASGRELEWAGWSGAEFRDGHAIVHLEPLPETAVRMELRYVCRAEEVLSCGRSGMYNTAHVIAHENDEHRNISASTDAVSRLVYSWYIELWTIDTRKPKEIKTTGSGNSAGTAMTGYDMHPGQAVEGARFRIYTDEELTDPLTFVAGFRTYKVCPDSVAKHVDEIVMDNGGRASVTGMRAGTYWIQETAPATGYDTALSAPIKLTLGYSEDDLPEVKLEAEYDETTAGNFRVATRGGPQILIDYRTVYDRTVIASYAKTVAVAVAIGAATGVGLWFFKKNIRRK